MSRKMKLELKSTKKEFRKVYRHYLEYTNSYDCGNSIIDYIASTRLEFVAKLNALMDKMRGLELALNGKIPDALEGVSFE